MAEPRRLASWSVARRTHSASTATAIALVTNITGWLAPRRYLSASESGMNSSRARSMTSPDLLGVAKRARYLLSSRPSVYDGSGSP